VWGRASSGRVWKVGRAGPRAGETSARERGRSLGRNRPTGGGEKFLFHFLFLFLFPFLLLFLFFYNLFFL
jgi:hypothetical protein